uniref:IncF plasmid conjugative transfer pilus assemblyprotein TraW n=1 Tax=Vibrio splendidus TaxID=29497 RepID=A0A0H3ZW65_VIBSP|nr:IncF plasmid conjugative transfer pilus assemblyprotein TraW [Vibrio splendidus]
MRHLMMVFALLLSLGAVAKDLGRMGPTFPIGEIDMLTWIEARLKHFEKTGKLEQMQTEFAEQVKQSVETPPPLSLSTTTTPKRFWWIPASRCPRI